MPPRRILFYSDAPYEGGAERYIEYLVSGFPTTWEVVVVAPNHRTLDAWVNRLRERGMSVLRPASSGHGLLRGLWAAVRDTRPDLVHLNMPHTYSASFAGAAAVARAGGARAVVSTEHLTMIEPMRLRGRVKQVFARACSRVITLSESNRRDLIERHGLDPERVRVVMNGVPDPAPISEARIRAARARVQPATAEPSTPLLVHVGALTERKGHRSLLRALATLRDRSWGLACVGEGEDRSLLEALAGELDLTDRVRFAGRDDDVPAVIAAAEVVVLPSRLEGVPLVLLEALAVGRPAVTTDVYGIPEIYADADPAACIVPPDDEVALAAALARVLGSRALREDMARAARALYDDRFTSGHMARATVDVYDEVWA